MMGRFAVRLEARDAARNLWRAYTLEAGRDLFGAWVVEVSYGRIGRPGRILHHSFIEMCLQLRPTLAGDETGTSRIG
jgi:predicted DNA-binding WGR domain protein